MSRIGRNPIPVPSGVKVDISGSTVSVTGPKGQLSRTFVPDISIEMNGDTLTVSRPSDAKPHRAQHGLVRSLVANMVEGVSEGFVRDLDVVGAGYRARMSGDNLVLQVGHSHPVELTPSRGVSFVVEGTNRIKVMGIDKESVGQVAAEVRSVRPPDPYKGKGVRYANEKIHLKPGKKAVGKKK
ncbi:MAG: 50S ribosomal protein L6 [Chloroflexota bacterium]|nr:50S ribosomal protein L6 [Chloroflexota bacterium]